MVVIGQSRPIVYHSGVNPIAMFSVHNYFLLKLNQSVFRFAAFTEIYNPTTKQYEFSAFDLFPVNF